MKPRWNRDRRNRRNHWRSVLTLLKKGLECSGEGRFVKHKAMSIQDMFPVSLGKRGMSRASSIHLKFYTIQVDLIVSDISRSK